MPDLKGGSPRDEMLVAEIGGERYFVASEGKAGQVGNGARSWAQERIVVQETNPGGQEFSIPFGDLSQGSGYTFADKPGTYDWANGWDCSAAGRAGSWPLLATGQGFTTTDYRGWIMSVGGYVYIMRGRYCCKYAIDDTIGAVWPIIEIHDFGVANVVAGRPYPFKGKGYVPLRAGPGGALAVWHELTTVVTSVVEQQTIAISGTPTSGTYTITFDGKTTAAIAYNAAAAAVQAALRLIPGLDLVTVSDTGSVPNFTHTVVMTGVAGALGTNSPPQMTSTDGMSGGTHAITHATPVAGTSDTWTAGAAGTESACFIVNKNLLWLGNGNTVRSCAVTPTTAGNWSAASEVGESGQSIVDFANYDRFLIVFKTDGPWTFDDSLQTVQELPDLAHVIDNNNGVGAEYSNGYVLIPHKTGLIRWRPGNYEMVGPEQEGALDTNRSIHGFGRVASIAPYGKQVFYCTGEDSQLQGMIGSFLPQLGQGRGPLIPHTHQVNARAYEALAVVTNSAQPASPQMPSVLSDDAAVGTLAWANPANAGISDNTYASVLGTGTSHYLKGLAPPANVPTGATVLGVKADIERSAGQPTFVSSSSGSASAGPVGAEPPGAIQGDVLVAVVMGSVAPGGPAGWTQIGTNLGKASAWYIIRGASAPSFTWTGSDATGRWITACYRGCHTTPVDVSGSGTANSPTSPTVTTGAANELLLSLYADSGGNFSATAPSGMTIRQNANGGVADLLEPTAGATGAKTWGSTLTPEGAWSLALNPSAVTDATVSLVKGGVVSGTNKALGAAWPLIDTVASYGGATDMWGLALTPADVNASNFGLVLSGTIAGTANVDLMTMTIYYSVPGQADPSSFLVALKIDSTRTLVTPEVYKLPRNNMPVVNDYQIDRRGSTAQLYLSRYYQPSLNVQKTWRDVEFWLELGWAGGNTTPFQVWAAIDEGTPFQLVDSAGAAVAFHDNLGRKQAFFPPASCVGSFVQLQFVVPSPGGLAVAIRDGLLRGVLDPLTADQLTITLILGDGEFEDRTSMRRTTREQKRNLRALTGRNAVPVSFKDIHGDTGYMKIESCRFREIQFKEFQAPVTIAQITARELPYT